MTKMIDPEFVMARIDAIEIRCPHCHSDPGSECFDPQTGYILEHQPAHFRRLQDAQVRL